MAGKGAEFHWNNDFNPQGNGYAVKLPPFNYVNTRQARTFDRLHDPSEEADSLLRDSEADAERARETVISLGLKWE